MVLNIIALICGLINRLHTMLCLNYTVNRMSLFFHDQIKEILLYPNCL